MRVAVILATITATGLITAAPAAADVQQVEFGTTTQIAPGVVHREFTLTASHGAVIGDLLQVDLSNPQVSVDLLHPPTISEREQVSEMAGAQHAVAGVNGDFFNISETHAGVPPTNSSDGPEIADGHDLKAAVPNGQRFGPGLPQGTSTQDVIGVGVDRTGRVSSLHLAGTAVLAGRRVDVAGLNQYAVAVGGIDAFTPAWGTVSRVRATCGTDTNRLAPCSTDTEEVTIRHGLVTAVSATPGAGQIPAGTVVLVGREQGADLLRQLQPGDAATVSFRLVSPDVPAFRFAVGGFPILHDGQPLAGLDDSVTAPRTSAGLSADGGTLYLATVDGRAEVSGGLTVSELADLMRFFGASDALNLDGGGSSTLVDREPGQSGVTVQNDPSDGSERAVANGIGVFERP